MSILPETEMRGGWGFPLIGEFMSAGVPVGLGVDTSALAGDVNLFAVLKFAMAIENVRAGSEFKLTARRALELVTIDAARIVGTDKQVGSLVPGKRADFADDALAQLLEGQIRVLFDQCAEAILAEQIFGGVHRFGDAVGEQDE